MKILNLSNVIITTPSFDGPALLISNIIKHHINIFDDIETDPLTVNLTTGEVVRTGLAEIKINYDDMVSLSTAGPEKIVICIMPDQEDILPIAKMMYHQYFKQWIAENPDHATAQWPELTENLSNEEQTEAAFLLDLSSKVYIDGWQSATELFDLVINFKTVMGTDDADFHQILADFLETPRLTEIDTYISQYRLANNQYLS